MPKPRHFRSKAAYRKYLAYKYIHVSRHPSKHPFKVYIRGKLHRVHHSRRRKIRRHHHGMASGF